MRGKYLGVCARSWLMLRNKQSIDAEYSLSGCQVDFIGCHETFLTNIPFKCACTVPFIIIIVMLSDKSWQIQLNNSDLSWILQPAGRLQSVCITPCLRNIDLPSHLLYMRWLDMFYRRGVRLKFRRGQIFTVRHAKHTHGLAIDICPTVRHYAVQGHSRSPILVPIESPYATSY